VKHPTPDDFEPVGVGLAHGEPGHLTGDVAFLTGSAGGVVLAPVSYRRLSAPARDAVQGVQEAATAIRAWQAQLEERVLAARDEGVSWDLLGWSVGTTGSAARKRWGAEPEPS